MKVLLNLMLCLSLLVGTALAQQTKIVTLHLHVNPAVVNTHYVALTWTASSTAGVVGYNALRAVAAGGPFVQINSTLINGVAFNDTSVTAGVTYFYVVTAWNGSTNSASSAPASATVPTP